MVSELDDQALQQFGALLSKDSTTPTVLVLNKSDITPTSVSVPSSLQTLTRYSISCADLRGVEELLSALESLVKERCVIYKCS